MTVAISLSLLTFGTLCGYAIGYVSGKVKGAELIINELKERIG